MEAGGGGRLMGEGGWWGREAGGEGKVKRAEV